MTAQQNDLTSITMSTQAFLILCRLFDGCYDELKKQEQINETVEGIAQSLLSGVTYLHEQQNPPKDMTISLNFSQTFFLRKLLNELLTHSDWNGQEKTKQWLHEALVALERAGA